MTAQTSEKADSGLIQELLSLRGRAYVLAARVLGPGPDAEDAVQKTCLDAVRRIRQGGFAPRDFRAWFLTAVLNAAREILRTEASRRRRETSMEAIARTGGAPPTDRDLIVALGTGLAALDEELRLPISLCYEQGLTQREAADVLEVPERTLSRRVAEGLERLRESLARAGYAAAPAAVLAGLAHTAPPVPAALAAAVEKLALGGAAAAGSGAAAASAATKGGIAMKIVAGLLAAGVVAGGTALVMGPLGPIGPMHSPPAAAPVNPYAGMQEREEVFEFAQKPAVKKEGDKVVISFASKGACDATVAIVGPDGKVVRHLASGVLGKNAPWPFKQGSLSQSLEWDGKDDDGRPVSAVASGGGGCKVKVGLGLDARFDKFEGWQILSGIKPLAVGKDGELYAVSVTATQGGVHVFGKDGKYVRTVLPPPAFEGEGKIAPERFAPIAWNKTAKGEYAPNRYRGGGGYDFGLSKYGDFFTDLAAGVVTPDGKLCLLHNAGGARLLLVDTRDGACAAGDIVELGKAGIAGMAASPDGKWIYLSGQPPIPHNHRVVPNHAVTRVSLEKRGKPEAFVGEAAKAGNDNAHFSGPTGIACDKDGNVYVHDSGNGRIQVFKPDGSHLKTLPAEGGLIGVSHKTGAIFLGKGKPDWTHAPIIVKLGGLDNPAKVAELDMNCGKEWDHGTGMLLSSQTDPPLLWFSGKLRGTPTPMICGIEDKGAKLAAGVDIVKANPAPSPVAVDVTTHQSQLHVDRRSGRLSGTPIGPDGCEYRRGMFWSGSPPEIPSHKMSVFKFDPAKKQYVSFENGDPAFEGIGGSFTNGYTAVTQDGKPVIGLPMFYARGAHHHQGAALCVAKNGDVYVGSTYSKETDAELVKAGLPRCLKGEPNICAPALRVYGPDGKLKTPCALPGLMELEGLRVGRSGAVYVVQPWRPLGQGLPDGLAPGGSYQGSRWGGLIKFAGNFEKFPVGRIEGAWEATPANPTHEGAGKKVKMDGALWTYAGVSPHSGHYSSCTCMKACSDLDDYERSFVVATQTCTVNVIDSNGNVIARLGGYGNMDSRGDDSAVKDPKTGELRPRRPDDPKDLKSPLRPLAFCLPMSVAATDDNMWVTDIMHRALVKTALIYRAEETVPAPPN